MACWLDISTARPRLVRGLALALAALLASFASPARAVDIVVTTTEDELTSDGDCSLRGAIRAANLNAAQDACPAGSSTARDTIRLADGATYSLVLAGADNSALVGDLDIFNNVAAADDLLIEVAGGGSATVSQDAAPDDVVFDVLNSASVTMRGITIRNGTSPATVSGGGVSTDNGSSLTLEDCAFADNFGQNNAGAIFSRGSLTVTRCTFTRNVAQNSAGAISTSSGSTATVSDSLFDDNRALSGSGGAIRNTGPLTVTGSTFVANRAKVAGGAIANSSTSADSLVIGTSCFVGNEDTAVVNFVATQQSATGSWWGASDGPNIAFETGSGDSVDFDGTVDVSGFATSPLAGCRPLELVANTHFEIDHDADDEPDRWRLRRLQQAGDGLDCSGSSCGLRMAGDGERSQALQTILAPGSAGDSITFSARSSAANVPASAGKYQVELSIIHSDGSVQRKTIKFSSGTHGFEELAKTVVASENYDKLKVRVEYGRASGSVVFDDVSVVLE
ncbi:MAG: CSLREA domain-containing protein [Deltaproteobacteria bacterium]|nr:CSLREA domain-containing protein [Deltaproteobacteria bacterium]